MATTFMLSLMGLALTGCVFVDPLESDEPEKPVLVKEKVCLSFQIEVPNIAGSRTPDGSFNDGRLVAYENYIDPASCQVLIFNSGKGNTTLRGIATDISVEAREDNSNNQAKRYTVWGYVEKEVLEGGNFKIMTIANWDVSFTTTDTPEAGSIPIIPGTTTIDDIVNGSLFEFNDSWTLGVNYIPMFGIKDCYNVVLPDNYMMWLDTMHMLRAMAKVEVVADSEIEIERAFLYNYSAAGYAAPRNVYSQSDYVKHNYKDDYVDGTNVPPSSVVASSIEMPCYIDSDNNKHFILYLPEFVNADADAATLSNASYIDIFFKDATIPARLDFKYYNDDFALIFDANKDDAFDIQRNYYYRFSVKEVKEEIEVEVYPYSVVELSPDFGIVTGEPIWEDVWSAEDVPEAMNRLTTGYFNWGALTPGRELRLYFINRTPNDAPDTEFFWISVRRFDQGNVPIVGTQMQYLIDETTNNGTLLIINLSQAMIDDIVAHKGISIMARYCILYRVTIK